MNTHAPSQYYMTDKAGHMCRLQGSSGNTGTWSVDEKWGLSLYVWYEQANTLSHRDYKQPQAVVVKR